MCEWNSQDRGADESQSVRQQQTHTRLSVAICRRFVVFSTWPSQPLCHPAFTFHKDWRRLSVSVEHRAKLNIFSLSVSLPSAFLPDSLRSFFSLPPPSPSLRPPSRRLTTDCFFSPPQIPSFSTKLCLFWWAATGKAMGLTPLRYQT